MNFEITTKIINFFRVKLEEKIELKKVIHNIGWLVGENIVRLLLGTGVGIWMARYMGPNEYGVYNYALAYVALFSSLVTLGLDSIVVREIVKEKADTNKILGSAFFLKIVAGIATFFIIVASIFFIKEYDTIIKIAIIILAGGFIFSSFDTIAFWFQSEIKSKFVVCAKLGAFIIANLLRIALLLFGVHLLAFVWLALAEIIMGALSMLIAYKKSNQKITTWKVEFPIIKKLLSNSWPLIFSGLAVVIYMKIDQIMIGNMLGSKEVGIYSVAVRLSEVWYFIPMAIASSVFPAIVALRKINNALYLNRLQIFYDLMMWLAILIAIPVAFFSKDIIYLIYGEQYIGAGPVLAVYIWAGIAVFLGVASEQFLLAENLTKVSFMRTALGGISNILLNLYLIPRYGIIGSAWATLISYFISAFSIIFAKQASRNFLMFIKTLNFVRVFKFSVGMLKKDVSR
ncbi:MAG: flippase [bacterium]|nr:flippase [bacterium]